MGCGVGAGEVKLFCGEVAKILNFGSGSTAPESNKPIYIISNQALSKNYLYLYCINFILQINGCQFEFLRILLIFINNF